MFLKSFTRESDDGLVEQLNGNIFMQLFCGVLIDPSQPLKDGRIVSAIRNRLAPVIDISTWQSILYNKWSPDLKNKDLCMTDATCYESAMRYPTDVKLLWECCEWLHMLILMTCHELKITTPRSKFREVGKARLVYAKQRRHSKSSTRKIMRRLLRLLNKLIKEWDLICKESTQLIVLTAEQEKRLRALREVYTQQLDLFNGKKIEHRIVSIDRPYIRPIVRGKENKRVEFGAKVNNIVVDGLSFIEHLSFEAFNEGIRLKESIAYHEKLTGVKVARVGADTIYANNANRTYCTQNHITTCFVPKGPKPKEENAGQKRARKIISNLRATVMEGSFGNQKLHFGVDRIAARNKQSEILQLFFGIHMANASTLAARKFAKEQEEKEKARKKLA